VTWDSEATTALSDLPTIYPCDRAISGSLDRFLTIPWRSLDIYTAHSGSGTAEAEKSGPVRGQSRRFEQAVTLCDCPQQRTFPAPISSSETRRKRSSTTTPGSLRGHGRSASDRGPQKPIPEASGDPKITLSSAVIAVVTGMTQLGSIQNRLAAQTPSMDGIMNNHIPKIAQHQAAR